MKKFIPLLISLCFISSTILQASHLMGGEITWKNYGSGKFIFEVKLYRDCNGISQPNMVVLQTNIPGFGAGINCNPISTIDISPLGNGCPTCLNPMGLTNAVLECTYQSDTIILNGIPPISGWHFSYTDCCRNNGITNLSGTGSTSFCLRAFMFPYNNIPVEQLNDNSPVFTIIPSFAVCARNLTNYNNTAFDPDLDSLAFNWGQPLDYLVPLPGTSSPFAIGYSYTSPLPSFTQNPLNIPANLNSITGNMTFTSYTPGAFVTVVKVSSYRCGVLIAEIYREIQIAIFSCSINNFVYNKNPLFSIANVNNNNGYFTDSIIAGDSVHYQMDIIDLDTISGFPQTVTTNGFGNHFGLNFTNQLSDCPIPPCATTNPPLPISDSLVNSFNFDWRTSCAHASNVNGCLQHLRTYLFTFKANDDFCPANGLSFQTLALSVSGPEIQTSGNDLYISLPGYSFQWYLNGVAIIGAVDSIITPTQQGIYTVVVTNGGGCTLISNAVNRTTSSIEQAAVNSFNFNVAPNPVNGNEISVLINSPVSIQTQVSIIDQLGRIVYNQAIQIEQGSQHIIFDAGILSTGLYTIQMSNGENHFEKKFIVN